MGNPSHSPIGKHFPNSKYENVKNKQIQISIFAPAGTKILDLFDSEHPYLELFAFDIFIFGIGEILAYGAK